jgi:excisionase family DNA binding protein
MRKPHSVTPKPPASAADLIAHVVISVAEAGQLLGLSRSSAYQAVQRGKIPSVRIGRRILVPTAPLLEMLGISNRRPPE